MTIEKLAEIIGTLRAVKSIEERLELAIKQSAPPEFAPTTESILEANLFLLLRSWREKAGLFSQLDESPLYKSLLGQVKKCPIWRGKDAEDNTIKRGTKRD